ncbi:MAG: hypothetical protein PHU85_08145, partial [Phycisphaerae bacterium]|nr:hypothetical protein [Phycisphaerae bacterium]
MTRDRNRLPTVVAASLASVAMFAIAAIGQPASRPDAKSAPAAIKAQMDELWRRAVCQLSDVHEPAEKQAAVPKDIGNVPVVTPRVIDGKGRLLCYAIDGPIIWAADDPTLFRIDPRAAENVQRFTAAEGLPDEAIQAMAVAGDDLWLITR